MPEKTTKNFLTLQLQSNLGITTTEGTGSKWSYFSGGLICQVWFKIFQYGVVHMALREPCHQRSVAPTCKRGRNGNDHDKRSLQTRWSLVRSAYEGKVRRTKKGFSLNLTYVVAFLRLNRRFGPTFGVRNSHFSGGRIFKNAVRTFESANWRDWNCVSAVFRWSLLSGGRKDRFDCNTIKNKLIIYQQKHFLNMQFGHQL